MPFLLRPAALRSNPMKVEVVLLPEALTAEQVIGRSVAVFDVLRATTTITAALWAGVREIFVYRTLDEARAAAGQCDGPRLLCGEKNCLPPPGFDLGNSPAAFQAEIHRGQTVYMATTNGTRALAAAREAALVLPAALVNAEATAAALAGAGMDVTLLCAGTNGRIAMEDLLGAGAVLTHLSAQYHPITMESDVARLAVRLFAGTRTNLEAALNESTGGRNVAAVGLQADTEFAAQLDLLPIVARMTCEGDVMRITLLN
jgi:2-phosphosulfolactate phosphatase